MSIPKRLWDVPIWTERQRRDFVKLSVVLGIAFGFNLGLLAGLALCMLGWV